ncbi:hypothetical protein [Microbacterium sp. CH-015]|uniref:hypothetical protein n=1 Tax=Microbacterium sp. CH-015 TaxID=3406734 RepID=UPI003C76CC61
MSASTDNPSPQLRGRRAVLLWAVGIGLGGALTAAIIAATAANSHIPPTSPLGAVEYTLEPTIPPDLRLVDEATEELAYDPIDLATTEWMNALQHAIANDPNFGTVAISPDRTTVTITWHGQPNATLTTQIAAAPDGLTVVIQEAAFQPGELQALIGLPDLIPGLRVTMGGMENDGSGLRIGIWELPDGLTEDDVAQELAAAIGRPDVPITVEVAQIVPAS